MTAIDLHLSDAAELAEMLNLLADWLTGPDRQQLAQSLNNFIGADAYDLTDLHTDLARFTFLLGHNDGQQLFGGDQP
jgi:hypothetical protein